MNTTTAQSSAPHSSSVPPPPGGATEWVILVTAVAWLGRQAWALFESKEKTEQDLNVGLINDLRKERSTLIDSATKGFKEITDAIAQLRTTLHDGQIDVDRDFQELKRDQAGEYAGLMQAIGKLEQKIDALHQRFDDLVGGVKVRRGSDET